MDPGLLALEAARRQSVDWSLPATAAATAAARDIAYAFGYVHPEAGTFRAIQAVLDQLDNPSTKNKDAYEKHGAGRGTYVKWKKKLTGILGPVVVDDGDADLAAALEKSAARVTEPQDGQAVRLSPQFLTHAASEPVVASDVLTDAAAASGVSLAEALDKLTLSAADQHAAAVGEVDRAEAEAVLRVREAADAAQDAADAAQTANAAEERARRAAALADSAKASVAAAHVAAEVAALEAAGEAAARDNAREAEARQRAEAAASAAGSGLVSAPPPVKADEASSSAARQTLTGQRVCIHGVQKRSELNGTYGRAVAFHAERGRYEVKLDGSREHVQTVWDATQAQGRQERWAGRRPPRTI